MRDLTQDEVAQVGGGLSIFDSISGGGGFGSLAGIILTNTARGAAAGGAIGAAAGAAFGVGYAAGTALRNAFLDD